MDEQPDKEEEKEEKWCWCCRFCDNTGPWQTDPDKIPKGWRDDPDIGLRCKDCVKAGKTH